MKDLLSQYSEVDEEQLWENLRAFLEAIIPVAEEKRREDGNSPPTTRRGDCSGYRG